MNNGLKSKQERLGADSRGEVGFSYATPRFGGRARTLISTGFIRYLFLGALAVGAVAQSGCRSAASHRERADSASLGIVSEQQQAALGHTEPFSIERPQDTFRRRLLLDQHLPHLGPASFGTDAVEEIEHWPDTGEAPEAPEAYFPEKDGDEVLSIDLIDALQIAAGNSREYQSRKEALFLTALGLDLERFAFDTTFTGLLSGIFSSDQRLNQEGVEGSAELGVQRTFEQGAAVSGRLVVDLVRLLNGDGGSSVGLLGDVSITVPLLRGAGRHSVMEPLIQAERDVVYAIYSFEEFKRSYAVRVADEFFSVLQARDQIQNAESNYNRLALLVERTEAFHERGRVTGIEVDQARQDLLRARESWISARERYAGQLDRFKITLGLPTDAEIEIDAEELSRLAEQAEDILGEVAGGIDLEEGVEELELESETNGRGRYEIDEDRAIELAWNHRLDLRIAEGEVYDSQRQVVVAADALRAGFNLTGGATVGERRGIGSAGARNARLDPSEGYYFLGADLDLPFSRRAEGIRYRESLVRFERAVREVQAIEDEVKLEVREALRNLLQQRENYQIQVQALNIAERRMRQAQAFQEADRAETRDVLEANQALIAAQNSLIDAVVNYRIAELSFQRDVGVLVVNYQGLIEEFDPDAPELYEEPIQEQG